MFGVLSAAAMVGVSPKPPPIFEVEIVAFKQLIGSLGNPSIHPTHTQFVKKLDTIPEVMIPQATHSRALSYASKGLIGQFTGLWPSPR
jgi:hypothetical protein